MPRLSATKARHRTLVLRLPNGVALFCCCTILSVPATAQSPVEVASRAARAMQEGRYPEAEQLYADLTRLTPQVAEVYSNLGLSRYSQKKFDLAESAFRIALGLKSDM